MLRRVELQVNVLMVFETGDRLIIRPYLRLIRFHSVSNVDQRHQVS